MCGKLSRERDDFTLLVRPHGLVPKDVIIRKPGLGPVTQDKYFSSHRFARVEILDWWLTSPAACEQVLLDFDVFYERVRWSNPDSGIPFPIPDGYRIWALAHTPIRPEVLPNGQTPSWVISVITTEATGEVASVHDRMPAICNLDKWLRESTAA